MKITETVTVPKGVLKFEPSGESGFIDFGNVTDFKIIFNIEKLAHYDMRSGTKKKDKEITLSMEANFAFTVDTMLPEVVRLFALADAETITQTAGTLDKSLTVNQGRWYELGVYNLGDDITVKNEDGTVTYNEEEDYILQREVGDIKILEGGSIADGSVIQVTGSYGEFSATKLNAGTKSKIVGKIKFVADPPTGVPQDIKGSAEMGPEGDWAFISDEWQQISFSGSFTKEEEVNYLYNVLIRNAR